MVQVDLTWLFDREPFVGGQDMTHGWLSIAFACAFGALIGTVTALEISARFEYGSFLWSIGALVGSITSYVAIDFRHFCAGVARSYRDVITWRPYYLWWRAFGSAFVASAAMVPTVLTAGSIVLGIVASFDRTVSEYTLMGILVYAPSCIIAVSIVILPIFGTLSGLLECSRDGREPEKWEERLNNVIETNWYVARIGNPVAAVFIAMRYAWRGLRYGVIHAPDAAKAIAWIVKDIGKEIGTFLAGVFVYVHSQRRTICFVDATLGAAIGYSFGSAIIGAIAGALLGIINYEVVSVRWLRLVPASR